MDEIARAGIFPSSRARRRFCVNHTNAQGRLSTPHTLFAESDTGWGHRPAGWAVAPPKILGLTWVTEPARWAGGRCGWVTLQRQLRSRCHSARRGCVVGARGRPTGEPRLSPGHETTATTMGFTISESPAKEPIRKRQRENGAQGEHVLAG